MLDKLVDTLLGFVHLFKFFVVMQPYEQGVLIRLGQFMRVLEPGLHWIIPLGCDEVHYESVVPRTHCLGDESVTTLDGKCAGFKAIVTYKVKDIQKALLEVHEVDSAVSDSCAGEIGRVLRESSWNDILHGADVTDKLTAACRKRGFRWGIEIMSVQLASLSLVKSIRVMGIHEQITSASSFSRS